MKDLILLTTKTPLVFVRHGRSSWNEQGRYQGSTDTQLSSQGNEDAKINAAMLENLLDQGTLDRTQISLVSSPLSRASETARIIQHSTTGMPAASIKPEFRELSLGRWEGLTSAEVKDQFYKERKSRKSDRWNFQPTKGESMAKRSPEISNALKSLAGHTIVVTHSMVLCVIAHLLVQMTMDEILAMGFPHRGLLIWDGVDLRTLTPDSA